MKILRLVYEWPPPWIGLTPAPFELTRAQAQLGHSITVMCGRWFKSGAKETIEGVKVYSFFREPIRGLMLITVAPVIFAFFLVWRLFNKPDVYHVHGHFGLYFYIYKYLFGFADKTPVVSHFHICFKARWAKALREHKKISFLASTVEWPLSVLSEKLAGKVANAFVFVGEDVMTDAMKYYSLPREKCYLLESGVNDNIFIAPTKEEKNYYKKRLGFGENDYVLGNVGFLVDRKNIHILIQALQHLPSTYKLVLIGKGSSLYISQLKELASKLSVQDRVTFTGEVSYPDIPPYYKALDVFILPSSYEGFPKVVLEALACSVPTIASGFKIPDINGLLELKEITATAVSTLVLKAVSLEVDRAKISREYSWKSRAKILDKIYNGIANQNV